MVSEVPAPRRRLRHPPCPSISPRRCGDVGWGGGLRPGDGAGTLCWRGAVTVWLVPHLPYGHGCVPGSLMVWGHRWGRGELTQASWRTPRSPARRGSGAAPSPSSSSPLHRPSVTLNVPGATPLASATRGRVGRGG